MNTRASTNIRLLALCLMGVSAVPALASAAESVRKQAERRVTQGLLQPLVKKDSERSIFSRAEPPSERRLRILALSLSKDQRGRGFVPFVIDARYGDDWHPDIEGCVYAKSGDIFVHLGGDDYRPAKFLLGEDADSVSGVCREIKPTS